MPYLELLLSASVSHSLFSSFTVLENFYGQSRQGDFVVDCLKEFSRCTLPTHSRISVPGHITHIQTNTLTHTLISSLQSDMCVHRVNGSDQRELYSNSCRLSCNTVVNPAKLISAVPERQAICISISMWEQFSCLIGQINEGAVTSSITSLAQHSAFHYLCSSNWMILASALKYVHFSSMNI